MGKVGGVGRTHVRQVEIFHLQAYLRHAIVWNAPHTPVLVCSVTSQFKMARTTASAAAVITEPSIPRVSIELSRRDQILNKNMKITESMLKIWDTPACQSMKILRRVVVYPI